MAEEDVSKPHPIPPYSEMILAAIDALKKKEGSNKSAISKYIESTYKGLPASHSTLLSHHLNRMKNSGQLVFFKNNYMRFDPNAPPRRGRGRPPKVKSPFPKIGGAAGSSSGRLRGRPSKVKPQQEQAS